MHTAVATVAAIFYKNLVNRTVQNLGGLPDYLAIGCALFVQENYF
jgi:hypothetical protein